MFFSNRSSQLVSSTPDPDPAGPSHPGGVDGRNADEAKEAEHSEEKKKTRTYVLLSFITEVRFEKDRYSGLCYVYSRDFAPLAPMLAPVL